MLYCSDRTLEKDLSYIQKEKQGETEAIYGDNSQADKKGKELVFEREDQKQAIDMLFGGRKVFQKMLKCKQATNIFGCCCQ